MKRIYILTYASHFQDGGQVYIENFVYNTKEEVEAHARIHMKCTCVEDLYMDKDEDKDSIEEQVNTLLEDREWSMENDDYTEAYGYKITEVEV